MHHYTCRCCNEIKCNCNYGDYKYDLEIESLLLRFLPFDIRNWTVEWLNLGATLFAGG